MVEEFVLPGDFLGGEEEFAAGENAFADSQGVFATVAGKPVADAGKRVVGVSGKGKRPVAKGDLAFARVEDLYDQVALVSFVPVAVEAASFNNFAYLRISQVDVGFTQSFRNNMGIGDFLRARVLEVTPLGIYLTIAFKDLGVIRAFCSRCRKELKHAGKNEFSCPECKTKELRKTPDNVEAVASEVLLE